MRKPKGPRAYGFTTRPDDDNVIRRIVKEAKPRDKFLLVSARDNSGHHQLTVLARTDVLASLPESLTLASTPVSSTWGSSVRRTPFRALELKPITKTIPARTHTHEGKTYHTSAKTIEVTPLSNLENKVRTEIQRIKNHLTGRTTRVLVEAL